MSYLGKMEHLATQYDLFGRHEHLYRSNGGQLFWFSRDSGDRLHFRWLVEPAE